MNQRSPMPVRSICAKAELPGNSTRRISRGKRFLRRNCISLVISRYSFGFETPLAIAATSRTMFHEGDIAQSIINGAQTTLRRYHSKNSIVKAKRRPWWCHLAGRCAKD